MRLTTVFIHGVTHGFTINCQAFVLFGELFVPALQRKIKLFGIDANQGFSESGTTGYIITPIAFTAAKTCVCFLTQVFRPAANRFIALHATQYGACGKSQNARQGMALPLLTTQVGNIKKELG